MWRYLNSHAFIWIYTNQWVYVNLCVYIYEITWFYLNIYYGYIVWIYMNLCDFTWIYLILLILFDWFRIYTNLYENTTSWCVQKSWVPTNFKVHVAGLSKVIIQSVLKAFMLIYGPLLSNKQDDRQHDKQTLFSTKVVQVGYHYQWYPFSEAHN